MKIQIPWRRFNLGNASIILGIVVLIWAFAFQRYLITISSVFGYLDEGFAIFVACISLVRFIMGRWDKGDTVIYALIILLTVEGLISNSISGLFNNSFAIIIDIISIFKVVLVFLWAKDIACDSDRIIRILGHIARIVIFVMLICFIISQFKAIGMNDSPRYGFKSFKFVFNNAGNFSKFFYFLIPLLLADLKFGITKVKKFSIVIACIIWISTLRSRAFSFVALLVVFSFLYFRGASKKIKIKWYHVAFLAVVAAYFSWDNFVLYFVSSTQARAVLLRYSIVTMSTYFPFGSGFGTYGSDIAATYYSPLYDLYGFRYVYGIGHVHTHFLNDNYWPMIFGQFGVIGTGLMVGILGSIHKKIYSALQSDKYYFFAAVCAMAFLLLSSVASKSYSEFSSICVFLLLGIMLPRKDRSGISINDDEVL